MGKRTWVTDYWFRARLQSEIAHPLGVPFAGFRQIDEDMRNDLPGRVMDPPSVEGGHCHLKNNAEWVLLGRLRRQPCAPNTAGHPTERSVWSQTTVLRLSRLVLTSAQIASSHSRMMGCDRRTNDPRRTLSCDRHPMRHGAGPRVLRHRSTLSRASSLVLKGGGSA